jgi:hypothetical protein
MRIWWLALAVALFAALLGCNPEPGPLVPEPPLPPPPREAAALPTFRDIKPADTNGEKVALNPRPAETPNKPGAAVAPNPLWVGDTPDKWKHIVLHHSASDFGNSATFDRMHRERRWDELGYHFVITNGRGGGDGRIEVGPRWIKQKHGAHCRPDPNDDNYWNEHGIGICLVGDFTRHRPSEAQLNSAAKLIAFLMRQSNIPAANVVGHGQVRGAKTECPGKMFPYADLLKRVAAEMK